ncbi:MAG: hypothetical protein KJ052_10820 [Candidatus Hydrogenedentes bacterium]|nr:hypothetical protein [Candidatus Hydrogenedentota bacterium]
MSSRAYTYVDRTVVRLGNRWIERTWSAFIGNSTNLHHKMADTELLEGRSREFALLVDGEWRGVMDFAEIEWSEENSPLGAALICRQRGDGLDVVIRTTAFHDNPGMVRQVSVANLGEGTVDLGPACSEALTLDPDKTTIWASGFEAAVTSQEYKSPDHAVALEVNGSEILFGQIGGGQFHLFAQEPGECAVFVDEQAALAGGQTWHMPPTLLLPYTEGRDSAFTRLLGEFLLKCRELKRLHDRPRDS